MDEATARILHALNRDFYEAVAPEFSESRRRLHPGIERVLAGLERPGRVLDLGCGDARVGHTLHDHDGLKHYVGVDFSPALLAQRKAQAKLRLLELDLTEDGWNDGLPDPSYDTVLCFSVLHHLAGDRRRRRFLDEMAGLVAPGGRWALSVWQVLHRERFRRRRRDWSEVGLTIDRVDPGDLLLDWKHGALRYVHHFEEPRLRALCTDARLIVEESWRSDGDSGDLGLYLIGRTPG